ncbi:MAG: N-acetylmuramoyl-L-alanine amidase, partial [Clostridia bacterium]
ALVYSLNGEAASVARRIVKEITTRLKLADRGVKARPGLGILRSTRCPAVLVETAFIDSPYDAKLLRENQQDFADAIFTGVTGKATQRTVSELTDINDIVWEYSYRGIVTDAPGMLAEMEAHPEGRLYMLARKALQYMRERNI